MNRNWVYSLFALWIVCSFACTQPKPVANVEVQKENFVFSIKGTDTLSLDKYELPSISPASKKPVMIFAFGGGFKGGDKADKGYIPYFEFLARNGFVVVSTDYRTTLKNLDPSKVSSPMDFIAALQHAIDTAVCYRFCDQPKLGLEHRCGADRSERFECRGDYGIAGRV